MIDFNAEPYFDDFLEDNKFYRILFRPNVAVQARELNQLQTILQNQIKRHGDHIFKNGTRVIPGEFSLNPAIDYIKLDSFSGTTDITNLIGTTIQDSNGLTALVIHAIPSENVDPATLYVSYTSASTSGTVKTFAAGATLSTVTGTAYSVVTAASFPTGKGTLASVKRGVYYINGYFVLCTEQTIVVDKYNVSYDASTLSTRIGFTILEETITQDDIGYESLTDNAQGTSNYGAPGAHRYFIDLILSTSTIGSGNENFVELSRIEGQSIIFIKDKTEYSEIEKTLARRTYDESGNYVVNGFDVDVREHRNNDRGVWNASNAYISGDIVTNAGYTYVATGTIAAAGTAPTHTSGLTNNWQQTTSPVYNRGIYPANATVANSTVSGEGNATKLAVGVAPGKAYIKGYEIEKTSTQYVEVDKPRNTISSNNTAIATSIGNYVQVVNVKNLPSIESCPVVTLYDDFPTTAGSLPSGNAIGTCRIRGIQYDGTNATNSLIPARLYLFDIKMNAGKDFTKNVKSFYNASASFTADISSTYATALTGSISNTAASSALTGKGGSLFTSELVSGDIIFYNDDGGTKRVVKISSVTDNQNVVLSASTAAGSTATDKTAFKIQAVLFESSNSSLVFPTPYYAVSASTDYVYYVIQQVTSTSVASNTLNISCASLGGTFESDTTNFFVLAADGVPRTPTSISVAGNTAALTFSAPPTIAWTVYATVRKTSSAKVKTITAGSDTFTTASGNAYNSVLTLSHTDCIKLTSVISGGVDISDWYDFDNGQRSSYYDYGALKLKPSYPTPTADVTVTYQYFTHSGTGDFFDISSYTAGGVAYGDIQSFGEYNLRDCIDFRPRMDSIVVHIPRRGYNMSADLTYYLARKDKIGINVVGTLYDTKGASSLSPGYPEDDKDGMTLCTLDLNPYTFDTTDVIVSKVDNRRYTMRDIGSLETRIDNLEYYTSLSLLEQETQSLSITDSSGLNRFKNGFIVDNFTGHNIGDVTSPDYFCSVDMTNGELRPFNEQNVVDLTLSAATSTNYKLYGDVVTLPLNSTTPYVVLAQNDKASRTESVNPFAIFSFIGDIKMNPSSDDWFEVDRRPDIINNVEGNYNTIATLAEKAGALGTVWNAWQDVWTGTWSQTGTRVSYLGSRGHGMRTIGYAIDARQVGQSRTGIKTSVVAKVDTQLVDDKILSTAIIPYIRSRNVLVQVQGLKPNTRFYPYFDNVDVSSFCTAAKELTYIPFGATDSAKLATHNGFDTSTNVAEGINTDNARRISGDAQLCLNIGDKITGTTSGATGILVGKDIITNPSTLVKTYKLYLTNVIGTFNSSESITGSISGKTGTTSGSIVSPSSLITSATGSLNLLFNIPNTNAVRFRTGSREFKLIDSSTASGQYTSRGRKTYNASGVLQTKQATYTATRNGELIQEPTSATQTIVQTQERVVSDTGWYDPLAQTFLVENCEGGAFISKIDLFFASIDTNIPVTIQIREVINGYPGKSILPFSTVTLRPSEISLSTNTVVDFEGVTYPSYDTPTSVVFPSPVYVKNNTEYALVVLSDSNQYRIWISNMGDNIPGTSQFIQEQPYQGVLYKSQNGSSWTPSDTQDMKFTVWRANFDTSVTANVELISTKIPAYNLESDPFQTLSGSTTVRVWHKNHGLANGNSVTIAGASGTVNGATVNGTFTVSNSTLDSYCITSATSATSTGFGGGLLITATRNIRYETVQPNVNTLSFPETKESYQLVSTDWNSPVTTYTNSVIVNDNNYYDTSMVVNDTAASMKLKASLSTSIANLSPVLDLHRSSVIAVGNKLDNPSESTWNVAAIDRVNIASGTGFSFSGNTITAALAANQALLKRVIPGTYIEIASATTAGNNGKVLVTAVDSTLGTLTTTKTFTNETFAAGTILYYYNSFFDEITPVGSSTTSKYISKEIVLAQSSNTIRVRYAASVPTEANILVYYKIGTTASDFSKTNWTLLSPDKVLPKTAIGSDTFYDVDYTATNLTAFTKLSVKLVMQSTNTAAVPRAKDLRIIACA